MFYLNYFYFVNNDVCHQVEFYNNIKSCEIRAIQLYDEYLDKLKSTFSIQLNEECLYVPKSERSISKFETDTNKHYFSSEIGRMPDGEEENESLYTSSDESESVSSNK